MVNRITGITKRDIFEMIMYGINDTIFVRVPNSDFKEYYKDENVTHEMTLYGRLDEIEFLKRLYPLDKMESYDSRYSNAEGDIWQHTVNNDDYGLLWVFKDEIFELLNGDDSIFLNFITEVFHPEVRKEEEPWERFLGKFNELLGYDGYELYEENKISGRTVYGW